MFVCVFVFAWTCAFMFVHIYTIDISCSYAYSNNNSLILFMDICLSVCPPVNMSLSIFRHICQFTMHFRGFRQRLVLNLPFRGSAIKLVQQLDPVLSCSTVRHQPLCRSRCTFWQEPTDCYGLISAINGLRDTWLLRFS